MMKLRLAAPELLIDLSGVPGQKKSNRSTAISASAPWSRILNWSSAHRCAVIVRCSLPPRRRIGDVQVRNVGTIGGSVAHADPAADYPAALLALESQFTLTSASGQRTIAASDFFVDTFTTALAPEELITSVRCPAIPPEPAPHTRKRSARLGLRNGWRRGPDHMVAASFKPRGSA